MPRGNKVFAPLVNQIVPNTISVVGVNDIILYALLTRIALSNNEVIEFQTTYDKATDTVELVIPPGHSELFNQLTGMQRGPNFKAFVNWLIGSDTLSSVATLDQDPNFVAAGMLQVWTGATQGNLADSRLLLMLPTSELSVVGHNFKVASLGGSLKISLVWTFDTGSNTSFDVNTSVNVSAIGAGGIATTTSDTNISTFNLIKGDIRETELITVPNVSYDDMVSIVLRRNQTGSADPMTEFVGILGLKVEFI